MGTVVRAAVVVVTIAANSGVASSCIANNGISNTGIIVEENVNRVDFWNLVIFKF
jgi:hypothetical protein